ncbi:MAG: hypothetical protein ACLVBY_00435 [Oscillospiraceae bacterium]
MIVNQHIDGVDRHAVPIAIRNSEGGPTSYLNVTIWHIPFIGCIFRVVRINTAATIASKPGNINDRVVFDEEVAFLIQINSADAFLFGIRDGNVAVIKGQIRVGDQIGRATGFGGVISCLNIQRAVYKGQISAVRVAIFSFLWIHCFPIRCRFTSMNTKFF